jgi:hypothetical protein
MGDLISRSELIKRIKGFTNISSEYFENPELLLDVIENQPTAYNLENVVAGVHNYFCKIIDDCNAENIPHEILKYNKEVCDIVRKGGVDD